ncbi:flagella basal body P-ring formation protein FlgA, partial [Escherichia coli]|uniref:flagella basal body P-ring formation protein FlgA n=1 Tax=Escherichia coli TaxID=562 RepID=UPI001557C62A
AWRGKTGQRVNVIASGDGVSAHAEGQALNNAALAPNARGRRVSGQVGSGVVVADGDILLKL